MKRLPIQNIERNNNEFSAHGAKNGTCIIGSNEWKRRKYRLAKTLSCSDVKKTPSSMDGPSSRNRVAR